MTAIHRFALVPYSAEQMYKLVNDVAHYPEFLPWCQSTEILSETETEMVASITVAGKGVSQSFTTRNTLVPHERIEMHLLDGPFKTFDSYWRFESLSEGSKVILDMEFEFANRILSTVIKPFFTKAVNNMVEAFTERAKSVYG